MNVCYKYNGIFFDDFSVKPLEKQVDSYNKFVNDTAKDLIEQSKNLKINLKPNNSSYKKLLKLTAKDLIEQKEKREKEKLENEPYNKFVKFTAKDLIEQSKNFKINLKPNNGSYKKLLKLTAKNLIEQKEKREKEKLEK